MTKIPKLLIVLFLVFLSVEGFSRATTAKFTVEQLKEDYRLLLTSLKEAHPGLYRYTPKEEFEKQARLIENKLDHPMTEEDFYKLVMPLIANIKCGHTKWHRQDKPDDRYPFVTENIFPLKLYFVDNKAYVVKSYGKGKSIPAASEIVSINGKNTREIIKQLRPYITIDANVQSALYEELNSSFNGYYASFIANTPFYQIEYKVANKQLKARLKGVTLDAIRKTEGNTKKKNQLPLRLSKPTRDVAILTIERFYVNNNEPDYYKFIDSVFAALKTENIQNLIIDVRYNEGGIEEYGGYLYSYLSHKDFVYYKKITLAQKDEFSFKKYAWLPEKYDQARQLIQEKDGEFLWPMQEYLQQKSPKPNAFNGKVYMLTNGFSFSVTSELAAVVHHNKRAVFVGEETGGAYYGDNSGVFTSVTLPNTKL
ncbi:MAG TPA: S41 family peptidase, partial [Segetibacter sp.]